MQATNIQSFGGWFLSVLVPVAIQYLIASFSWGHKIAPSCTFFEENYLTDNNLLIASLLPEVGGISGVKSLVEPMSVMNDETQHLKVCYIKPCVTDISEKIENRNSTKRFKH